MATATTNNALQVLQAIAADGYLKASAELSDNYNRVWARDAAVGIITIVVADQKKLYNSAIKSLLLLQQAANENGQIPSNVAIDESGKMSTVSFGGPVGRTDANFWWIIATLILLDKEKDAALQAVAENQIHRIFTLAESWEFNGKHLMYVPMSSNWADEYITNGYVLYDQILRYWSLELAAHFYQNEAWKQKASQVKLAIKQHFLVETELDNSLFTHQQRQYLQHFDIEKQFIASFSPGEMIHRYDGWSIALLLLLDIPSKATKQKLCSVIHQVFQQNNQLGVPAFWPFIQKNEADFQRLQFNHHYRFKNEPGHFHNGGIWPVVNGYLIAALALQQQSATANELFEALIFNLQKADYTLPFAEYFDAFTGTANGVKNLCYSAAGFIFSEQALQQGTTMKQTLMPYQIAKSTIYESVLSTANQLLQQIVLSKNKLQVLSVAGESGSGKTTMGKAIKQLLEEKGFSVLLLHQDDYFKLPPQKNHQARLANFDHIGTSEVKLDLIDEQIKSIKTKQSKTIQIPVMNWKTDSEEAVDVNVENINVVVVEGTYTTLLNEVETKIFITSTYQQTKKNRLERNREIVTDFIEKVLAKESAIIQSHAVKANFWIDENLQLHTHFPY